MKRRIEIIEDDLLFKKIAIFGVGLIGGSFALSLKKAGKVQHIVGMDRTLAVAERARQLGLIDDAATSVADWRKR